MAMVDDQPECLGTIGDHACRPVCDEVGSPAMGKVSMTYDP